MDLIVISGSVGEGGANRESDVAAVQKRLKEHGYDLSWGPGETPSGKRKMAFVDDPDGYEIELLEG